MEAVTHKLCPHTTRGTKFCDFLKEVIVAVKEEGELTCETIHIHACIDGCLDIADGVGESEGHFVDGSRACLTHVITTNTDGIPAGQILLTIAKNISDETHRVVRWVNVCAACNVCFDTIILHGTGEFMYLSPLLLSDCNRQCQQNAGG